MQGEELLLRNQVRGGIKIMGKNYVPADIRELRSRINQGRPVVITRNGEIRAGSSGGLRLPDRTFGSFVPRD